MESDLKEVKNQLKLIFQVLREQDKPHQPVNNNDDASDDIEENIPITSFEELEAWERKLASKEEQKKMVCLSIFFILNI